MHKKYRLVPLNWDVECYLDLMKERGFIMSDPPDSPFVEDPKKLHRYMYGPNSPLYGTTFDDEEDACMRWRCECGYYHDSMFKNEICPYCGKPVKKLKSDPRMTGWVNLGESRKIIHPYYYMKMREILGKKKVLGKSHYIIDDIVSIKQKVDVDGHIHRPTEEELDTPPTSPFFGIGMREFQKQYKDIMYYFSEATKNVGKKQRIARLIADENNIFTSHIPVYTTLLRPQSSTGNTLYYNGLDKQLNPILNIVDKLDQYRDIDMDSALYTIQYRANKIWEYDYEQIHGKEGVIRGQLKGGPLNYTARNEIIPDFTLRDDEVDLSYSLIMVMFKNHIVHYYMKLHRCVLAEADYAWNNALRSYSEEFYNIMVELNRKDSFMVLINRNPTLNIYSMLRMRVRNIIPNIHQYTMSLPLTVLEGFNADFDGDVMNILGLVSDVVKELFRRFDPLENMIIGFDTGYINPLFSIKRGMRADLLSYLTM